MRIEHLVEPNPLKCRVKPLGVAALQFNISNSNFLTLEKMLTSETFSIYLAREAHTVQQLIHSFSHSSHKCSRVYVQFRIDSKE